MLCLEAQKYIIVKYMLFVKSSLIITQLVDVASIKLFKRPRHQILWKS